MHRFSAFWHMRLPHRLQGQKVKSQSHGAGAYCGGHLAAQLVTSFIPTLPPWLLTRPVVNFTLHCSYKSNLPPEMFRHLFMNCVTSLRTTIAYLLMAQKKVTELQLLWSIETVLSVFDYLIQQTSSDLNYMPC